MSDTCTLYGIPNCTTVKKARDWLAEHQIAYVFHDFKKQGVGPELIAAWLAEVELDTLLNRKGTSWRGLAPERKAAIVDQASAIAAMIELPSLIKRPVLNIGGHAHVGFSDGIYQQIFKT